MKPIEAAKLCIDIDANFDKIMNWVYAQIKEAALLGYSGVDINDLIIGSSELGQKIKAKLQEDGYWVVSISREHSWHGNEVLVVDWLNWVDYLKGKDDSLKCEADVFARVKKETIE